MPDVILINASLAESLVNFRGDLIKALVCKGLIVHVSAPELTEELAAELRSIGAQPHSLHLDRAGQDPVNDVRYFVEMLRLQRQVRPDLILNYTIKPNIWASLAARLLQIPAFSMVTGIGYMMLKGKGLKRKIVQLIARTLYGVAVSSNRAVIFQNKDDAQAFIAARIVRAEQVRLVRGSGVNVDRFAPAPLPEKPIFLMIARLLRTKGTREYCEAACALKASVPEARCILVGPPDAGPDGLPASEIEALSNGAVEYVGPQSDVRPFLAQASVYVLPSYREGTPRSVLEAMAMGRAVITTDAPGCRETVVQGVNGVLVPVGDAAKLAEAMMMLAGDAAKRSAMGSSSHKMATEIFDVHSVNREMLRHLGLSA